MYSEDDRQWITLEQQRTSKTVTEYTPPTRTLWLYARALVALAGQLIHNTGQEGYILTYTHHGLTYG